MAQTVQKGFPPIKDVHRLYAGFPQHFETQNQGESRRFEEKFRKIRGQFRKKSRRIEEIFQSQFFKGQKG